jgi:hypothetical protein
MLTDRPLAVKPRKAQAVASWYMRLNGTYYGVEALPSEDETVHKVIRLRKEDSTIYDVASTIYGDICDCPDFLFNSKESPEHPCKHILALKGVGIL